MSQVELLVFGGEGIELISGVARDRLRICLHLGAGVFRGVVDVVDGFLDVVVVGDW